MNLKKLYTNDGPVSEVKPKDKTFIQLSSEEYNSLSPLEKRTFHIQELLKSVLPLIHFVTLIQTIGIVIGFIWILTKL